MMKYGPEATWQPPNQAFERETTFQRDYRKHSVSARQPFKPSSGPAMSDVPFDDTTAYKHEYVRYPVEPRMIKVLFFSSGCLFSSTARLLECCTSPACLII